MSIQSADEEGTEHWKQCWNVDAVLRNGNDFYFVRTILDAEFTDI